MSDANQIATAIAVALAVLFLAWGIGWIYVDAKDKAEQRRYEREVADLNAERAKRRREHDHGDWSRPE